MIVALVIGTLLAIGALAFVLSPVFFGARIPRGSPSRAPQTDMAVVALREIEFDRATGKLSDIDYHDLRTRYMTAALAELRDNASSGTGVAVDPVEAAVLAYRANHRECLTCGSRPELDATYCSECGRFLDAKCDDCGAAVEAMGARFCPSCGHRLAA